MCAAAIFAGCAEIRSEEVEAKLVRIFVTLALLFCSGSAIKSLSPGAGQRSKGGAQEGGSNGTLRDWSAGFIDSAEPLNAKSVIQLIFSTPCVIKL